MRRKLKFEQLERRDLLAITLPYSTGFDTPDALDEWQLTSTNQGRIEIVDGRLQMDDYARGGRYSHNTAILPVDMEGQRGVLSGDMWSLKDEAHLADRVKYSSDGGSTWNYVVIKPGRFEVPLPASTTHVAIRQYDNYPAPLDGRQYDNISIEHIVPPTPLTLPVMEDFSDGLPTEGWEFNSTNDGRIRVVNGALQMDDAVRGGSYSLNEAILHVDLDGQQSIYLSGTHRSINDETHAKDGIFISTDGVNWERVSIHERRFKIAIPVGTTQIKFAQYDNYPASSDGREWDDLRLEFVDHSDPEDWNPELGFTKDLFIDGGVYLSTRGVNAAQYLGLSYDTMFTNSTSYQRSIIASSSTDLNGALLFPDGQPRYRAMFVNGGKSGSHGGTLGSVGRERYREFFANGGSYTGSCAGAYLVTNYSRNVLGLIPDKNWNTSGYSSTRHSASFSEKDGQFYETLKAMGPTTIHNIPHYGGPAFNPRASDPPGLSYLGRTYNVGGRLYNSPYLAVYQTSTSGRLVVQPSHPEYASSGSKLTLQAAIYAYALEGSKPIPDLKANLTVGETVTMDGVTEKVGDGQYHRYTVDVTPGTEQLTVSVTGGVELYVQYDSPANAETYICNTTTTCTFDAPAEGTWHVSVHGDKATTPRNGSPYSVTIG